MPTVFEIPPDHDRPHRADVARWHNLRYPHIDDQAETPNYPKLIGTAFAGLLQALPPTLSDDVPKELTDLVHPADLLDDGVSDAAALGVVYLRPVKLPDDTWTLTILSPLNVAPTWAHRQMVEAWVWVIADDPRYTDRNEGRKLVLLEQWETASGMVKAGVYEAMPVESAAGRLKIDMDNPLTSAPDEKLVDHPFFREGAIDTTTERRLIPVVWDWENGRPACAYAYNEGLLEGLAELAKQEQEDAELARHRIAMPEDLIGRTTLLADDGRTVIAAPGFNRRDNLLRLPPGLSAQEMQSQVQQIDFDDTLVQRDRIERRTNELLESVGIAPQSIGRNVTGRSDSAAAKRADNQLTMQTIAAPGRRWSRGLTMAYRELARLNGGSGDTTLTVTVNPGIRVSPAEAAETAGELAAAEAASLETRVRTAHPDWNDEKVAAEVAAIRGEGLIEPPSVE